MRYLTVEEVLYLHYRLVKKTGGKQGIRDIGLLQSAIARPYAGYDGFEPYTTVFDKAAVLSHSIILNHPFIDGNKRTGIAAGIMLLRKNGYYLKTTQQEMINFTLLIAKGQVDWPEISDWFKKFSIN